MPSAEEFKKHYAEMQGKLKKDIRPMIARSGFYNPDNDMATEYQHYPRWVEVGGKKVIAHNEQEENALLGVVTQPAKKVDVDIANIQQPETVQVRRGRPPKAKTLDLPADLK